MISFISGEIEKYDLIIAVGDKWAELGFYLGKGSGYSQQYYSISNLSNWRFTRLNNSSAYEKPYKSYIAPADKYRFIKYSPELINNEEVREMYKSALEAMKLLNI